VTERNFTTGPVDRIHWGLIVAGMFTAISIFVVSSVLASAFGFGPDYFASRRTGYETGTVIWGAIAAFIAFGIGAFITTRSSSLRGYGSGLLHGFLVWAVGVPVLVYALGTRVGPMLGITRPETTGAVAVAAPEQTAPTTQGTTGTAGEPGASGTLTAESGLRPRHMNPRAWWMLISLATGFAGAMIFGAVGARVGHGGAGYERTTIVRPPQ